MRNTLGRLGFDGPIGLDPTRRGSLLRFGTLLSRRRLRRAAVRFAEHGWDVVPGAYLTADRYHCGPGCTTMACGISPLPNDGTSVP